MPPSNKKTERIVAVIDVGTNSTKLLVTSGSPAAATLSTVTFLRETPRLGAGLEPEGKITNNAQVRTINTLERFLQVIRRYDCDGVFVFSTHTLRKADNAAEVVTRIEHETGLEIKILTGDEEAHYAYLSARPRVGKSKRDVFLIDVGGGSTEFVCATRGRVTFSTSLPLGALHLTERFILTDPVSGKELIALQEHVSSVVSRMFRARLGPKTTPGQTDLIASGGSATTIKDMLAASTAKAHTSIVHVAANKIRIGDIRLLHKLCIELPLTKRRRLPGLDPARADIIVAGLAVVTAFMEAADKRVLRVNEGGVREGVALHVIQNNLRW